MNEEMQTIAICQEMGYTYDEFMSQPLWFLDMLKDKIEIDSDNIKKAQQRAKLKRR